jgi:hypothetical protein
VLKQAELPELHPAQEQEEYLLFVHTDDAREGQPFQLYEQDIWCGALARSLMATSTVMPPIPKYQSFPWATSVGQANPLRLDIVFQLPVLHGIERVESLEHVIALMTTRKWQCASRFRCNAFCWKSDTPIQRIKDALTEIKSVAKKEPVQAAKGAVLFLEKLAPAIEQVDSSSGGIGTVVNRAIETLVRNHCEGRHQPRGA